MHVISISALGLADLASVGLWLYWYVAIVRNLDLAHLATIGLGLAHLGSFEPWLYSIWREGRFPGHGSSNVDCCIAILCRARAQVHWDWLVQRR